MISNIIDWAIARKFQEYCTLEKEFEKTEEETKEILEAIKNNDLEKIKDGIGDTYITLVIGYWLTSDLEDTIKFFKNIPKKYTNDFPKTPSELFIRTNLIANLEFLSWSLDKKIKDMKYDPLVLEFIVNDLELTAAKYNFTLEECVEYAFNQIKDRTGRWISGQWVKDK